MALPDHSAIAKTLGKYRLRLKVVEIDWLAGQVGFRTSESVREPANCSLPLRTSVTNQIRPASRYWGQVLSREARIQIRRPSSLM